MTQRLNTKHKTTVDKDERPIPDQHYHAADTVVSVMNKPPTNNITRIHTYSLILKLFLLILSISWLITLWTAIHVHSNDLNSVDLLDSMVGVHVQLQDDHEDYAAMGVEPLVKILATASSVKNFTLPESMRKKLPKWSDVMALYGKPRIFGLDQCARFRESIDIHERYLGVAGTFNSGTNLLHSLVYSNCNNPSGKGAVQRKGVLWQVPWGKHYPASYRMKHLSPKYAEFNRTNVLPVVVVRDPYNWMQSMCRQPYNVHFPHGRQPGLCPNIVPFEHDIKGNKRLAKFKYIPVNVAYDSTLKVDHQSLPHYWNDYYNDYWKGSDFPRLIVRMEDLIFHGEEVIQKVCECAGFTFRGDDFTHVSEVVNANNGIDRSDGLMGKLIKYGNATMRRIAYPDFQLQAAHDILDPDVMRLFGYKYEEV